MNLKAIIRNILKKVPGAWNLRLMMSAYRAPLRVTVTSQKKMLKLKDRYKGKRCFIIGNGPSLTAGDLDKLKNEYTFAANRIYKIFPQTKWRPTFYCIQDENMLREMDEKNILETSNICKATFIRMHSYHIIKGKISKYHNLVFIPISGVLSRDEEVRFSSDADCLIYDGNTVTYMSMQIAAHMGFREIYLVGMDHNFPYRWTDDGKLEVNDLSIASHFYDGAENNVGKEAWKRRGTNLNAITKVYQTAEDYSRQNGFRIYNATRGGKLEVFERVNLDDIL